MEFELLLGYYYYLLKQIVQGICMPFLLKSKVRRKTTCMEAALFHLGFIISSSNVTMRNKEIQVKEST